MRRLLETGLTPAVLVLVVALGPAPPSVARGQETPSPALDGGRVAVEVRQNGAPSSGSFVVYRTADPSRGAAGEQVAVGRSGLPVRVAPGTYDVVVRLDGAIDRPERWSRGVVAAAGQTALVREAFETSVIEVRVVARGRRAAGTIRLRRAGETADVATLGSGVRAVISAGTWDVLVRYRTDERAFSGVVLEKGRGRVLTADFDQPPS